MDLKLKFDKTVLKGEVNLSGSKSITNRILLINAIGDLNLNVQNSSTSEDSTLLFNALKLIQNTNQATLDINHAGTAMRFLTAFLSVTKGEWILTGSDRMKQRPIKPLVDCLLELGADINYAGEEGFPPLKINGKQLAGGEVSIRSDISSQFISALLLIAPKLTHGLTISIKGEGVSRPYINMTLELLRKFGILIEESKNQLKVNQGIYQKTKDTFVVESDWSSASYYYELAALSKDCDIQLNYLNEISTQSDSNIASIYDKLGVKTTFMANGVRLTKKSLELKKLNLDFTEFPDIAQTLAATCVGLNIPFEFKGLQTLKIKETDRIEALKAELEKFGALLQSTDSTLVMTACVNPIANLDIETYHDHRMAMCIAPLALKFEGISIINSEVVSKSYPEFWKDLERITKS
ncbi:MAG: 3-phosphoshikimate 1-carboxyvinyltransferase [Bacteroidetes bacterium]|nr:3-phosphoshikimate 1-carboxyvinyltransferase [Bacteroidota bacterium]MCA6444017.1 3-phosphoshikimate 1-carboxyvinyltransferase [Bacteroidota bacterium]